MNDDTISRRAAIDAFMTATSDGDKAEWCRWVLKQLPSAQSEKSTTAEKSQLAEEKSTRKLIYLDDAIRIVESFYKVNADIRRIMAFELRQLSSAQPEWNNHTVACMLAELFDDTCACNYNGIDEWLPEKCELLDSCPNPAGVACWEQFLKHRAERRIDDGD